ncbi:MAG: hypothetical protein DI628_02645 [Blastochloris viridis]|uniref:Uncharacterized protein n=1 Tax=Blastochloris viridis TaxID=1079 RepID=A0A6N4R4L1_BLAVI|nr:MAG: hypothetical protein DI628_02645 [Blastochloris viridis]
MSAPQKSEHDGYVIIERTSVFFVALDQYGRIHMGFDAFRKGDILTLPGGGIEESDRNLFAAARRETRQEFGKHMRYELIDAKPYVFLCSMEDDSLVTNPSPGQRVKLRIVWFVMELHDHIPLEQPSREVINPRAYHITRQQLEELPMRESSRIGIREAYRRGILPTPKYQFRLKPDMESLRQQMMECRVEPAVCDYHGLRKVKRSPLKKSAGPFGEYLHKLEIAERQRNQLERLRVSAERELHKHLKRVLKPGTVANRKYIEESEKILLEITQKLHDEYMTLECT